MKRILFIISILFLTSCGREFPILNDTSDPFIVYKIKSKDKGFSMYYGYPQDCKYFRAGGFSIKPLIIAPSNLYQVGDTILLKQHD